MLGTLIGLFAAPAIAGPLEVALADKTGGLFTPSSLEVGLTFKGPEDASTSWENIESNALSFVCSETGTPPTDEFVEQLLLKVGDDKWALAPGSSVKFSCGEGKTLSVTDVHGTSIGAWKGPVAMNVAKAKPKAAR